MKKTIALIVALTICITAMLPMTFDATQTPTAVAEDMTTTTTTAVFCAATQVSCDNSPMQIGETRAVRVYHPKTGTAAGMEVYEVSENIAIEYDENGDTLYITALAAGDAKLYVREKDCAFGAYVYITVAEDIETTTTTTAVFSAATQVSYDRSPMRVGETRAVRVYHPTTGTSAGISISEVSDKIELAYYENSDTLYITAVAPGEAKLYVREKNCAFGAYVYVTVAEPLRGDVDEDGVLTSADARLTLQYVVGEIALLAIRSDAMFDYDADGVVTTADARDILIATL